MRNTRTFPNQTKLTQEDFNMKRTVVIGVAVVLALALAMVIATAAFAQGPSGTRDGIRDLSGNGNGHAYGFVDADGDGVCDNAGQGRGHAWGFVDENGDGVNDRFVDADGDGVCDNAGQGLGYGRTARTASNGQGAGMARRGYGARGANFVDANGNGICDLLEQQ